MATTTAKKTAAPKPAAKKTAAKPPVAKKTPARKAPTKAAAAGTSTAPEFVAEYPVADMKPHPKNPRRHTSADEDMVASIKEHGLIEPVILGPDGTLVAGNRRHDGLVKAKVKTAPALIRKDLDTAEKQLEAALIENCHRENLTPIEEAEAFDLLRGMGYTQNKIATKVGRPVATVRDRLKLLKLDKSAQDKIHVGQLTLAHALDLVSFDDDPATQKKLAKAAIEGTNFDYQLKQEKERRAARLRVERHVEELVGLGATEVTISKGEPYWRKDGKDGLNHLGSFGSNYGGVTGSLSDLAKKEHKGHLGYSVEDDNYQGRILRLWCTDQAAHHAEDAAKKQQLTAEEKERQAEWERQQAEREQVRANAKIAADLRTTAVLSSIGPGLKLDATVTNVLRTLLPYWIWTAGIEYSLEKYFELAGVPEDKQWRAGWQANDADHEKAAAHMAELAQGTPYTIASALFALLVGNIENAVEEFDDPVERLAKRRYFELLTEGLGHQLTEIDDQLLAAAQEPVEEIESHPHVGEAGHACIDCGKPSDDQVHADDEVAP